MRSEWWFVPATRAPGIRKALEKTRGYVVGVSPIVGGKAVKGPADRIMPSLGLEASAYRVARFYEDFIDHIIIDRTDAGLRRRVEGLGLRVSVVDTIMKDVESSCSLAAKVMAAK